MKAALNIRRAKLEDVSKVARLQIDLFPFSNYVRLHIKGGEKSNILDSLNMFYLENYGQLFYVSEDMLNNVDGFIMGYYGVKDVITKPLKRLIVGKIILSYKLWPFLISRIADTIYKPLFKKKSSNYLLVNNKYKDITVSECAHLFMIGVKQSIQGSGISKLLLNEFISQNKKDGKEYCMLVCSLENKRAMSFYTKMGFEEYGISKDSVVFIKKV